MRLASSTGKDWVSEAGVIEPRSDLGWETIEEYQVKDIANLQISQTYSIQFNLERDFSTTKIVDPPRR